MTNRVNTFDDIVAAWWVHDDSYVPKLPDVSDENWEKEYKHFFERTPEEQKQLDYEFLNDMKTGQGFGFPDDEGNVFSNPEEYEAYHGCKP